MPRYVAKTLTNPRTGEQTFVPLLPITIVIAGKAVNGYGVIDSGADDVLVPAGLVAPLGVDYDKLPAGTLGMGAGNMTFEARPCVGAINWGNARICDEFKVAPGGGFVLLGRKEFFTKYTVKFLWSENPPVYDIDLIPALVPGAGTIVPRSARRGRKKR